MSYHYQVISFQFTYSAVGFCCFLRISLFCINIYCLLFIILRKYSQFFLLIFLHEPEMLDLTIHYHSEKLFDALDVRKSNRFSAALLSFSTSNQFQKKRYFSHKNIKLRSQKKNYLPWEYRVFCLEKVVTYSYRKLINILLDVFQFRSF